MHKIESKSTQISRDEPLSRSESSSSDTLEEADTTSSFSLQECLDEFRARRVRRISSHSRDMTVEDYTAASHAITKHTTDANADADLINQNRCNKEQERKCKPCKDGFCYCFTSDSGDGACSMTRDPHYRHTRRSRRSESSQHQPTQNRSISTDSRQQRRQSAPAKIHTKATQTQRGTASSHTVNDTSASAFTTVSSLKESSADAPLIHIIQELHDNCVISEIRVNKQKLPNQNSHRHSWHKMRSPKKTVVGGDVKHTEMPDSGTRYTPSAPVLSNISENESLFESESVRKSVHCTSLEESICSRSKRSGGRLLKHRLSNTKLCVKPRNSSMPPPKPPRSTQSLDAKTSAASLTSTTSSLREAERILDEFLLKNGVKLPETLLENKIVENKTKLKPLPSCPSLSDIERVVSSKKSVNYAKNLHKKSSKVGVDKPSKEIKIGWSEPKISEMLNYDVDDAPQSNKLQQFISHEAQAEPQQKIGWRMPKVSLDTVDGGLSQNLASNMEKKDTPIKSRIFTNKNSNSANKNYAAASKKFIWSEQFSNLSPWQFKSKHHMKSNLKRQSKRFLQHSKKKILRFVSPKKCNDQPAAQRTVGVQTCSHEFLNETGANSPPGSYHSPMQSNNSALTQVSRGDSNEAYFDFSREIKSPNPPKKMPRARKLDFPRALEDNSSKADNTTKTYRSYQSELDNEVSLSRMGCLLSNIRAKLEASDQMAMRTFREVDKRQNLSDGLDYPDNYQGPTHLHSMTELHRCSKNDLHNEPIYSEIEEDSIHVSASPSFDNKTPAANARLHVQTPPDIEALYAKVNKTSNAKTRQTSPKALGKFLHDSLQQKRMGGVPFLESHTSGTSYGMPSTSDSADSRRMLSHSLNNINEQHSPPKHHRHSLTKSDLSLQRSELFLDNLCQSEIVLPKVVNQPPTETATIAEDIVSCSDTVSYDIPDGDISTAADRLGMSSIEPPRAQNQSTPKKPSPKYTTKPYNNSQCQTNSVFTNEHNSSGGSSSCPVTPQRLTQSMVSATPLAAHSLSDLQCSDEREVNSLSALQRYRIIKDALRRSFRKGRTFFKNERTRLCASLNLPSVHAMQQTDSELNTSLGLHGSSQQLNELLNATENLPTNAQLLQAVSICRQLPEFEISTEMVEAERLLLYSSLKRDSMQRKRMAAREKLPLQRFFIDGMKLPVQAVAHQDIFFNYYYICTFECDGIIKSTQSVECQNGIALFQDCGIEFFTNANVEDLVLHGKIFMLRLRKVSMLSMEPQKAKLQRQSSSSTNSTTSSTSSMSAITSRFRLHAVFTLRPVHCTPFKLVTAEPSNSAQQTLRVSGGWCLPITPHTKSTNLASIIQLQARVEIRFPKSQHAGFLNVQDPHVVHNWNLRWCTLVGHKLCVWQEANDISEKALITLDLAHNIKRDLPVLTAAEEVCARPRAFVLHCLKQVTGYDTLCFAADTQTELNLWLQYINETLEFLNKWL